MPDAEQEYALAKTRTHGPAHWRKPPPPAPEPPPPTCQAPGCPSPPLTGRELDAAGHIRLGDGRTFHFGCWFRLVRTGVQLAAQPPSDETNGDQAQSALDR